MKRSTLSHSFLNIVLVFVESALTLLLRLDPELRKAAYPLAKQETVVCLRLYLPHVEIYATFSYKGVLLDANLPANRSEPDVIINAYSMQVFNAMTTHDSATTEKLQMRGEASQVQLVKQFIMQMGLGGLIQSIIKRIKGEKSRPKSSPTEDKTEGYKLRITEQQTQINTLTIKNRELETTTKELESKQKVLMTSLAVAVIIAVICLALLLYCF